MSTGAADPATGVGSLQVVSTKKTAFRERRRQLTDAQAKQGRTGAKSALPQLASALAPSMAARSRGVRPGATYIPGADSALTQ
eukprot:10351343-Alexandrium_andersonii.AAC.1